MNWDRIEGKWKETRGNVRARWGKLTDSDLDRIAGKRDQLLSRLQERYGWAMEQAEREVRVFEDSFGDSQYATAGSSAGATPGTATRHADGAMGNVLRPDAPRTGVGTKEPEPAGSSKK
jgi:uncharacterized protein YjbJ (UPF0337 family)